MCPICGSDLESYPLSYKSRGRKDGEEQLEIIQHRHDRSKIVGKAVRLQCKNHATCRFKFTTKVELKPQSLQQIVQNNICDHIDTRFNELVEYSDWCLNFQRILDRKQRVRWKSEILQRFKSFEIAEILKSDQNSKQLLVKEGSVINSDAVDGPAHELYPLPKLLHKKMNDICPTCLQDISKSPITGRLPLVYCVPMMGYPSSHVKAMKENESARVPILISILNETKHPMKVNLSADTGTGFFEVGCNLGKYFENVPTCLLSHVQSKSDWKAELEKRDTSILERLSYKNDFIHDGDDMNCCDVIDRGGNWITTSVILEAPRSDSTVKGQISFKLTLTTESELGKFTVDYTCCALV